MQTTCSSCSFALDDADNFCRRCGLSSTPLESSLPVTRTARSVTVWRPHASPVVKGAAVMAAGTIGQFVVRRAISGLVGGSQAASGKKRSFFGRRKSDNLQDEAQIITETMMVKRVRIRRPT